MSSLNLMFGVGKLSPKTFLYARSIARLHPSIINVPASIIVRYNSQKSSQRKTDLSSSSAPSKNAIPEHIRKTIPGETEQSNSLLSRLPSFPLRSSQTLTPKPGVPTSATTNLRTMLEILNKKDKPELIYEAEPHKLYFLVCGVMAFIFSVYGLSFTDWGYRAVWKIYLEDDDLMMFFGRLGLCSLITGVAMGVVYVSLSLPTRLIRRIWFIPANKKTGTQPMVKFTSHPLLPGTATPVYTMPLENLQRSHRAKVFTRNGIYGTHDRSTFFFLLKESNRKFGYWMVDRNGWFWGDGRVFDVLFGKESLEEAEKGQSHSEKLKEASEKLKEEKKNVKKEYGVMWQEGASGKMLKKDIKDIVEIVKGQQKVSLDDKDTK
ncbi:hypothetical protein WICPIJ_001697 [Wickerhamomyces pijperi]|uniref:Uncharacterized protein n=1 Tax=Wickerhamomyces pijperi TaxID=599730 RepID=A0A9P8QD56_WICPI|nr:hypothetical protein WICPIJ_001697 [Wickerhamomyces pijperi]